MSKYDQLAGFSDQEKAILQSGGAVTKKITTDYEYNYGVQVSNIALCRDRIEYDRVVRGKKNVYLFEQEQALTYEYTLQGSSLNKKFIKSELYNKSTPTDWDPVCWGTELQSGDAFYFGSNKKDTYFNADKDKKVSISGNALANKIVYWQAGYDKDIVHKSQIDGRQGKDTLNFTSWVNGVYGASVKSAQFNIKNVEYISFNDYGGQYGGQKDFIQSMTVELITNKMNTATTRDDKTYVELYSAAAGIKIDIDLKDNIIILNENHMNTIITNFNQAKTKATKITHVADGNYSYDVASLDLVALNKAFGGGLSLGNYAAVDGW